MGRKQTIDNQFASEKISSQFSFSTSLLSAVEGGRSGRDVHLVASNAHAECGTDIAKTNR
jgi:hypothetical protein